VREGKRHGGGSSGGVSKALPGSSDVGEKMALEAIDSKIESAPAHHPCVFSDAAC
jgi:hypothetical protein